MELRYENGLYIAACAYTELLGETPAREVAKQAGFRWNPQAKEWQTADTYTARRLRKYADVPCAIHLEKLIAEQERTKALSRASTIEADIPCPPGLSLYPFQKVGVLFGAERPSILLGDDMGTGKQQPIDSKVLAPNGWQTIGSLVPGDCVIGSSGQPTAVIGVFPQGVKPSYRVTMSDGSSVEAGPDHLWSVAYMRGGRRWATLTLTTQQLLDRPRIPLSHAHGRHSILDLAKIRFYLPMLSQPVAFTKQDAALPIPGYTLGQLIANGSLAHGTPSISMNTLDAPTILPRLAGENTMGALANYGTVTRISLKGMTMHVRSLDLCVLSRDKHIPRTYQTAPVTERLALLQGLMDGDGSCSQTRNKVIYHTISPQLAADVCELVEGLGGIASIRAYDRSHEDKPTDYQVRVRLPLGMQPFTVPRKAGRYDADNHLPPCRTITSVEYVREVESVCIAVDAEDKLYATEHAILTHNTLQTIGILNVTRNVHTVLVVCPNSVKLNWRNEAQKWLLADLGYRIEVITTKWTVDTLATFYKDSLGRYRAMGIINYDILHKFCTSNAFATAGRRKVETLTFLGGMVLDQLVADEAHAIKGDSRRSRAVMGVTAKRKALLTGTPIPNRPIELWNLLHYLDPLTWNNRFDFGLRFCAGYQSAFGWDFSGSSNKAELQEKLRSTVLIRRLKSQVATEIPKKTRQVIEFSAHGASRLIHAEWAAYHDIQKGAAGILALKAAVELAKAEDDETHYRQAITNLKAGLTASFREMAKQREATALAKLPQVIEHILSCLETQEKVVVYFWHRSVAAILTAQLAEYNPAVITGSTPDKKRQMEVERFQTDPTCRVFLGSIPAAKEGITLTAASLLILVEIDWVPSSMQQVEGRIDRLTQTEPTLIQYLVFELSLDATMLRTTIAKLEVIEAVLDTEHQFSIDELDYVEGVVPEADPEKAPATAPLKPAAVAEEAIQIDPTEVLRVHRSLQYLAGVCDFAHAKDGQGFNMVDARIGHQLAMQDTLTPRQAVLGQKIIQKYHAQLAGLTL